MEYVLLILALFLMVIGFLGSFLPVIPGPPLSWLGLFCIYFVDGIQIESWLLWLTFALMVVISVLDYVIPAQGTKRFGGSKYGIWGTNIGLLVGIVAPIPGGFILGPFVGALVGELICSPKNMKRALKAAFGSFIGFLLGTFIKVVYCLFLFVTYGYLVWDFVFYHN